MKGTFLAQVRWLRLCASTAGAWVQCLFSELGSHMPQSQKRKESALEHLVPSPKAFELQTRKIHQTETVIFIPPSRDA